MTERRVSNLDEYLRRDDTPLARALRRIAPARGVSYLNSWQKETTERVAMIPVVIVAAPISAGLALAVKLTEGGSGWFVQERNWGNDKRMKVYKIRTMTVGAEHVVLDHHDKILKQGDSADSRITTMGRILRKYELDELPQLVQVLTGHLSLTGLRPVYDGLVVEKRTNRPKRFPTWYKGYAGSKLGLLSMSSVLLDDDLRKDVTKRIHYDIFYIKNANLGLDLYLSYKISEKMLDKLIAALRRKLSSRGTTFPTVAETHVESTQDADILIGASARD